MYSTFGISLTFLAVYIKFSRRSIIHNILTLFLIFLPSLINILRKFRKVDRLGAL